MRLIIHGCRLMDPTSGIDWPKASVVVEGGKIAQLVRDGAKMSGEGAKTISAAGLTLTPGWIDTQVRLGEPGLTRKETIRTGTEAASRGGFTSVLCLASTVPANDSAYTHSFIQSKVKQDSKVRVFPIGALSKGREGEELSDMGLLKESGLVAVSDSPKSVSSAYLMRKAMDYAKRFELPVVSFPEDSSLRGKGVMNEGLYSTKLGLRGIPKAAEEIIVQRDILLSEWTGAQLHLAPITTAGSVRAVREAKAKGLRISAATTLHHLCLTDDRVQGYDSQFKVFPPLREEADVQALLEGLEDGTIDVLTSDHDPQSIEDTQTDFESAEAGIAGLETAMGLGLTLVHQRKLRLETLVRAFTHGPSQVFGLPKAELKVGASADFTVFDAGAKWVVDKTQFRSKGRNNPFEGWPLVGRSIMTIVDGEVVYTSGEREETSA